MQTAPVAHLGMHIHFILVKHVSAKNAQLDVKLATMTKRVIYVMMVMERM
jgi:hypothetical protein